MEMARWKVGAVQIEPASFVETHGNVEDEIEAKSEDLPLRY